MISKGQLSVINQESDCHIRDAFAERIGYMPDAGLVWIIAAFIDDMTVAEHHNLMYMDGLLSSQCIDKIGDMH